MVNFNDKISSADKVCILFRAGIKLLRGFWFRLFLKKVKGSFLVGKHVHITHGKHITCGKNVKFEDFTEIHGLCNEGLQFGDNVTISRGVMIRPSSYYGGDCGTGLVMGANSSIGPMGYIGCSGRIIIGKNVMFGPKCSLFAENHIFSDTKVNIKNQGVRQKGITIGDDCWIGSHVIILDGVTIGKGVVIGAGSIVTHDVPNRAVAMGSPAKVIRYRGL
ncbi:acyltransferase [Oceanispirochaeta crateris]|uniref:Acyltransferase n=1 Tax=Oceanispirochaeta crateris TaxID=2518645 RepID=A0A5C1QIV3_9SPIO|nr:acyltransferase [Oceanispirochaeta crateris]QEN06970.1 acyltransferase [Oceanispirochaeta crateris]